MTEMATKIRVRAEGRRLAQLEAEAKYARQRFDLYRAKVYGPRSSNPTQLRKLQEACKYAEARLERAKSA
jgi:hypothetical protein